MSVTVKEFKTYSSDREHELSGVIYYPEAEIRGYLQIVHGMTEHIARYKRFMTDMAEEGYVCFGYDHLGHGRTARDDEELGYIARRNGWELLVKDVGTFSNAVFEYCERGNEPYYLLGHSMGSFIVRLAVEKGANADKLVVMGTGGANGAANAGIAVIELMKRLGSDKRFSPFVDNLAFGTYNKKFGGGSEKDPKPWLSCDDGERERYYADKYCSFNFSLSAMGDLIRLNKYSNAAAWYKTFPKNTPVLLVSGEDDPVGNYGKGVREVSEGLKKRGIKAEHILYRGARHEILNDFTYDTVKKDILKFLDEGMK